MRLSGRDIAVGDLKGSISSPRSRFCLSSAERREEKNVKVISPLPRRDYSSSGGAYSPASGPGKRARAVHAPATVLAECFRLGLGRGKRGGLRISPNLQREISAF